MSSEATAKMIISRYTDASEKGCLKSVFNMNSDQVIDAMHELQHLYKEMGAGTGKSVVLSDSVVISHLDGAVFIPLGQVKEIEFRRIKPQVEQA